MKLTAKLRIVDEKNVKFLMKAFLKNFNPENSILICGETAKLEIDISNLPNDNIDELSDAISHCEVIELGYGKFSKETCTTDDEKEENAVEQPVENLETLQGDQSSSKTSEEQSSGKTEGLTETGIIDKIYLHKIFDKFYEESNTFREFLEKVFEYLELSRENRLLIVNVIRYARELEKTTWVEIEKILSEKGVSIKANSKVKLKREIEKHTNLRAIGLIKILIRYGKQNSTTEEKLEDDTSEKKIEGKNNPVRKDVAEVLSGSNFERRLLTMDKKETIGEKLEEILKYMRWESLNPQNQYIVFNICKIAIRLKEITFDSIFADEKMKSFRASKDKSIDIFSAFIERFMKNCSIEEEINSIDFLKYLQDKILTDEEKSKL